MNELEKRIREAIAANNKIIRDLKLQNQNLAALLPRQKKKKVQFPSRPATRLPPRPAAKKK